MRDMPEGWAGRVKDFCALVPGVMDDFEKLLTRNRIFVERTRGIGYISRDDAVNWGLTGPMARASGVTRDVRKDEPYLCYAENWDGKGGSAVEFKVPVAQLGDVLGRYLIRLEEMRQAAGIIDQLIDNIPPGPVNILPNEKMTLPDKSEVYSSIEGLIHHFERIMSNRGFKPPVGEAYGATETANGELGFYLVSDGGRSPYRVRCRPPSLLNYQTFAAQVVGHQLSDVVAIMGSINVIAGELDR